MTDKNVTLAFGTDGIRGNADHFPFTQEALVALGRALTVWARAKYATQSPQILIADDTRISGQRIKQALCYGLRAEGATVLDGGVLTTPAVFSLIKHDSRFNAGIVISASHNPYHDNGIKVFDAHNCKITPQDERAIVQNFGTFIGQPLPEVSAAPIELWSDAALEYQKQICSQFPENFLEKVKVVLDCANGATSVIAPELFRALGAQVFPLAAQPNGTNINAACGSLHPESLAQAVLDYGAQCGFAFDGDGDRVVAVNNKGEVKDGDDILALLLELPAYQHLTNVVGTLMTNCGFELFLQAKGKTLLRTNVGEKYVSACLEEKKLCLGGEISGHIIMKDYLATGDGIFVALKVLESVLAHNNWQMKTFNKFPQVLLNVPVTNKKDLTLQPYAHIIADYEKRLGDGRLLIRYSGTEPLLRVMTEASTYEVAHGMAQQLAGELKEALEKSL